MLIIYLLSHYRLLPFLHLLAGVMAYAKNDLSMLLMHVFLWWSTCVYCRLPTYHGVEKCTIMWGSFMFCSLSILFSSIIMWCLWLHQQSMQISEHCQLSEGEFLLATQWYTYNIGQFWPEVLSHLSWKSLLDHSIYKSCYIWHIEPWLWQFWFVCAYILVLMLFTFVFSSLTGGSW